MTEDRKVVPVPARPELLGVYLNDHLAGAAAGTALADRLAGSLLDRRPHPLLAAFGPGRVMRVGRRARDPRPPAPR